MALLANLSSLRFGAKSFPRFTNLSARFALMWIGGKRMGRAVDGLLLFGLSGDGRWGHGVPGVRIPPGRRLADRRVGRGGHRLGPTGVACSRPGAA